MNDLKRREKVFAGLEEVVHDFHEEVDEWGQYTPDELRGGISVDCDWFFGVLEKCQDALALLKAQSEVIDDLIKVGYPHNFQREEPWIVNYMYAITDIIKKAVNLNNGNDES